MVAGQHTRGQEQSKHMSGKLSEYYRGGSVVDVNVPGAFLREQHLQFGAGVAVALVTNGASVFHQGVEQFVQSEHHVGRGTVHTWWERTRVNGSGKEEECGQE